MRSAEGSILPDMPVGPLVAARPGRAAVLEAYGIDYCCGGKLSLRWFCDRRGLDVQAVIEAIEAGPAGAGTERASWLDAPLSQLVEHLTLTHHVFLRHELPRLDALARGALLALGAECPDLARTVAAVERFADLTLPHLDHEERVVFPLIV